MQVYLCNSALLARSFHSGILCSVYKCY